MTDITRRDALKAGALAAFAAGSPIPLLAQSESDDRLTLWYRQPAAQWVEALPIGSGRLGAMVFGGVPSERLQLNEDTLWAGGPYNADNPEALAALPEVRRLIFEGRFREANTLADEKMMGVPVRQMPYLTLGDLMLVFRGVDAYDRYRRELNLDEAVARTRFESGGALFTREVFASPVAQVIVVRLTCDQPGRIDFALFMQTPLQATARTEGNDTLVLRGKNVPRYGVQAALSFEARVAVATTGGSSSAEGNTIVVRGADSATLWFAAATSYKSFKDVSGDPRAIVEQQIASARAKDDDTLLKEHLAEHRRLFRSVSLDLGSTPAASRPTDERVRESQTSDDPQLAALYFQFGRYLLISCSRPGTQPATLQGLWNDSMTPPWGCKYTININTEMNYWPAEPTGLGECVEPLISLVRDLVETGARTARLHYGARGWVCHHNTDLWRACAPIDGAKYGLWPTGGAWLCMHLWDHYDYGRDRRYLESIYPVLKGAAEFFLDTLIQEPRHKWLVTSPSLSPENVHPHGSSLCAGPTMDAQIIRDLFAHCIEASEILGIDIGLRAELAAARDHLPPNQIGRNGQLQEWIDDWDMEVPEIHHRHVSHLYGVYPSGQINVHDTPELAAAARKSLEIRGDEATGWGIGWRLNLWARLQDGERASRVLSLLLGPQRTFPNLFDSHPPFQIDGNFGGVSGIAEMLMQSYAGVIHLLPALPKRWASGSVRGLRARGGYTIDINWQDGRLSNATIHSSVGGKTIVRYAGRDRALTLAPGKSAQVRRNGSAVRFIIL